MRQRQIKEFFGAFGLPGEGARRVASFHPGTRLDLTVPPEEFSFRERLLSVSSVDVDGSFVGRAHEPS